MKIEAHSPDGFARLMQEIWESPDLGMYDKWHNANKVAHECGLVRTGGGYRNGEDGNVYRWPDKDGVWINRTGSAVLPASRIHRRG